MRTIQKISVTALFWLSYLAFIPMSLASPSVAERKQLEAQSEEAFLDLDASLAPVPTSKEAPSVKLSDGQVSSDERVSSQTQVDEATVVSENQTSQSQVRDEPTQQELYKRLLQEEADSRGYRHDSGSERSQDLDDWHEMPSSQPAAIVVEQRPRRRWYERRHFGLWHLLHHIDRHQRRANNHDRNKYQRRAKNNYRQKRRQRANRKAKRQVRRAKRNQRRASRAHRDRNRRRR